LTVVSNPIGGCFLPHPFGRPSIIKVTRVIPMAVECVENKPRRMEPTQKKTLTNKPFSGS
jgi:hypothetical protein